MICPGYMKWKQSKDGATSQNHPPVRSALYLERRRFSDSVEQRLLAHQSGLALTNDDRRIRPAFLEVIGNYASYVFLGIFSSAEILHDVHFCLSYPLKTVIQSECFNG